MDWMEPIVEGFGLLKRAYRTPHMFEPGDPLISAFSEALLELARANWAMVYMSLNGGAVPDAKNYASQAVDKHNMLFFLCECPVSKRKAWIEGSCVTQNKLLREGEYTTREWIEAVDGTPLPSIALIES